MKTNRHLWKLAAQAAGFALSAAILLPAHAQTSALSYPATRSADQVDTYHGTRVADPYRWLEDDNSAETKAWVQAQNAVTEKYFAAMPQRLPTRQLYTAMFNYERYGVPFKEGGRYFWTRNDGLQQQAVLYTAASLTAAPTVALDPNTLSKDGTVALTSTVPSRDGQLLAYGVAVSGSDWQTWRVRNLATGQDLPDRIDWVKFSAATWTPDGKGFFYGRYEAPKPGEALSGVNYFQKVYYHRLGTPQVDDVLVMDNPAREAVGLRHQRQRRRPAAHRQRQQWHGPAQWPAAAASGRRRLSRRPPGAADAGLRRAIPAAGAERHTPGAAHRPRCAERPPRQCRAGPAAQRPPRRGGA